MITTTTTTTTTVPATRPARRTRRAVAAAAAVLALVPAGAGVAASSPTVAPAPSATTCRQYTYTDVATLRLCDFGQGVRDVQTRLNQVVSSPVAVDGYFGARTEAAVREFQAANGLAVDGVVGPATWNRLVEATGGCLAYEMPATALPLDLCSQGLLVARLQQLLNAQLSGGDLTVDGRFGPATAEHVRRFQSDVGLAVDAIVGPRTWWDLHTA